MAKPARERTRAARVKKARPLRVLVACEESQAVCVAFRAAGHVAFSCDLRPCSGGHPEWHFQVDVFEVIEKHGPFDLLVAFPPCTHLASSGAMYWAAKRADGRQQSALAFCQALYWADVPRVAIENPVGALSSLWMTPTQIFQPHEHGDAYTKRTALWLRNLPQLRASKRVAPKWRWGSNSTRSGPARDGTRKPSALPNMKGAANSALKRSKTFPGVARAMAAQWGAGGGLGTQTRLDQLFGSA